MLANRRMIIGGGISFLYFIIVILFSRANYALSGAIMAIALSITIIYVYDYSQSIFNMSNIICIIGFYVGYFLRFLIGIIDPSRLTDFAPYPMMGTAIGHIKSCSVFLVFIVCYAIVINNRRKKAISEGLLTQNPLSIEDISINRPVSIIIFFVIYFIDIFYRFKNMRLSTQLDYGTFDQFFKLFSSMIRIFAYTHLFMFSQKKKLFNLFCYLLYLIPTVYLAFIQAWKGTLLIEIIILCIVFQAGIKRIKLRYIILVTVGMLIIFPVISMIRDNYRYGTAVDYSVKSLVQYNTNNNVLGYYVDRFEYYDGTYYSANVSEDIAVNYKNAAGTIASRFFSGLIPRVIWANKPIVNIGNSVTYVLLRYPRGTYNNLTVGLLADAYLDSGFIGVILLGLIYGWLVGTNELLFSSNNIIYKSFYLVLGYSLFGFLEGDIAAKALGLIYLFVAFVACNLIFNGKIVLSKNNK